MTTKGFIVRDKVKYRIKNKDGTVTGEITHSTVNAFCHVTGTCSVLRCSNSPEFSNDNLSNFNHKLFLISEAFQITRVIKEKTTCHLLFPTVYSYFFGSSAICQSPDELRSAKEKRKRQIPWPQTFFSEAFIFLSETNKTNGKWPCQLKSQPC